MAITPPPVVLDELEAAGVTVDRYAGTSMGAIIAAAAQLETSGSR